VLISKNRLRHVLTRVLEQRIDQGCDLDRQHFLHRIEAASDSFDRLQELADELRDPPLRADWAYNEPLLWPDIQAASVQLDPDKHWAQPDLAEAASRARAGFLGSVCGCILGKPLEVDPTLAELEAAGRAVGEWPLNDYISESFLERLGRRHESWQLTTRGRIAAVAADDDIHYTLLGMRLLETAGPNFDHADLHQLWSLNLAPGGTWGPERTALLVAGLNGHHVLDESGGQGEFDVLMLNPGDEMCGALIRADAYGYACPGNPDLAAWLAWKDASFTHIKTGVYGPMFIAALIATCHTACAGEPGNHRLAVVEEARRRIPGQSRFSEVLGNSLAAVAHAQDWQSGYAAIHGRYREYSHCRIYQEIGTLVNTLKFAESVGHGICLQVSQGNDTDSFGATAGSVLGTLFGPGHLEDRWLLPFSDRLAHGLADLQEYRLDAMAGRIAALPRSIYGKQQMRTESR
jgi:ADP-ribosylglycohydrolase